MKKLKRVVGGVLEGLATGILFVCVVGLLRVGLSVMLDSYVSIFISGFALGGCVVLCVRHKLKLGEGKQSIEDAADEHCP